MNLPRLSADGLAPPELHLGDLARALGRLQPGDERSLAAVTRSLGFGYVAGRIPPAGPGPGAQPTEEKSEAVPPLPQPTLSKRADPPMQPPKPLGRLLTPYRPPDARAQPLDMDLQGAAVPPQQSSQQLELPPGLFNSSTTRSILFFALATVAREAEIDVEALARYLSFEEPWKNGQLPRLPRSTLRRGVQLLIDRRISMTPFYHDQNSAFEMIRSVVGENGVTFKIFQTRPDDVLAADSLQLEPYEPPRAGTPVLVLSDLGIGHSSDSGALTTEMWARFARRLRRAGCPTVAFVPYPPSRWPAALARCIKLVWWDRPTTPRTVRRSIGMGHEVGR